MDNDADPAGSRVLRERLRVYFGLEPNIVAASLPVFLLGMGEELWKKFLPKYLEALGAGVFAIGFFGTVRDFLDAVYQYPGGWIADRFGRRTAFTFFILREIGEPSRKAMIVDFAEPHLRARSVGLYYLVRSMSITPAALTGALLWQLTPQTPFVMAGVIGLVGTVVFALTVDERYAS